MNNNSKVLALKYRPQTFDDLIGQEVVAETITNSIKADKIPNAYLFTGIRGIGKTTTARIVAKALNCSNGIDNLCKENLCENCDSITNSSHIDVMELNGADKTSINDIREIIELSKYRPASAKYKIFIIDEVHQISTSAFNGLLKILEEPPEYIKFIFATTEIRKVPVTILSRCQRFDLSRIKSSELFDFIKKIKDKENGKVTEDALKLIVKISEGSVRDALSLLDRGLLSLNKDKELDLSEAQKIFGYFDKSQLIEMFNLVLQGDEKKVLEIYRKIFDQGINPKVFINDFLELIYYFKNINSLTLESTNFSLNDEEFSKIKKISNSIDKKVFILFWQFTIKTIDELEIVSNPNLSVEMFLVRLIYLKGSKIKEDIPKQSLVSSKEKETVKIDRTIETVNQIKNVSQEDKTDPKLEMNKKIEINSFKELINLCNKQKEVKLKYELETNVNLVSFENCRMEISFNDNLDKNFIKELSNKLFEWTENRWIITLSQKKGKISMKEKDQINQRQIFEEVKKSNIYKEVLEILPDAELIDVKKIDKESND